MRSFSILSLGFLLFGCSAPADEPPATPRGPELSSYVHDDDGGTDSEIAFFDAPTFTIAKGVFVAADIPEGWAALATFTGNVRGEWAYRGDLRICILSDAGEAIPVPGAQTYIMPPAPGGSQPISIQGVIGSGGKARIGLEGRVFAADDGEGMSLYGSASLVVQAFPPTE